MPKPSELREQEIQVTRLIIDGHDAAAFGPIASLTVGGFRDWLLSDAATSTTLARVARGITPEMAAAVSKLMRNQDLILVAKKCEVVTRFRNVPIVAVQRHDDVVLQCLQKRHAGLARRVF